LVLKQKTFNEVTMTGNFRCKDKRRVTFDCSLHLKIHANTCAIYKFSNLLDAATDVEIIVWKAIDSLGSSRGRDRLAAGRSSRISSYTSHI